MLIIDKEHVERITERLKASGIIEEAISDAEKMLETKEVLLWRADVGSCCETFLRGIAVSLENEVDMLKDIISALKSNDTALAVRLLEQYSHIADRTKSENGDGQCRLSG